MKAHVKVLRSPISVTNELSSIKGTTVSPDVCLVISTAEIKETVDEPWTVAPVVSEKLDKLNVGGSIPALPLMPIMGTVAQVRWEDRSPKEGISLSPRAVRSCSSFQPLPLKSALVVVGVIDSYSAEPLDNPGKAVCEKLVWHSEAAKSLVDVASPIGWSCVQDGNNVITFGLQHNLCVADPFPQLLRVHDHLCGLQSVIDCYDILTSLSLYVKCDRLLCLDPHLKGVVRHECCVYWFCCNNMTDMVSQLVSYGWLCTWVPTKEGCSNMDP